MAKAFQAKGPAGVLSLKEVDIAIAQSLPDHMEDDAERIDKMHLDLKRLGFFWCDDVSKGLDYGRDIPSLVDYAIRVLGHEGYGRAKPAEDLVLTRLTATAFVAWRCDACATRHRRTDGQTSFNLPRIAALS